MRNKKKGFTLVELLVVIAIIALLMGILLPALSRVRLQALKLLCGANISGVAKSMLVFVNDFEKMPYAGNNKVEWRSGALMQWNADNFQDAYQQQNPTSPTYATVTASEYMLVRYTEVGTGSFVCPGDEGVEEFQLAELDPGDLNPLESIDATDYWDFGPWGGASGTYPMDFCTYAYTYPYAPETDNQNQSTQPDARVRARDSAQHPILADRNPLFDKNAQRQYGGEPAAGEAGDIWDPAPLWISEIGEYRDEKGTTNSACHNYDGQNVAYLDASVEFEETPAVGIEKDNIWTPWCSLTPTMEERLAVEWCGSLSVASFKTRMSEQPWGRKDTFLINDHNWDLNR